MISTSLHFTFDWFLAFCFSNFATLVLATIWPFSYWDLPVSPFCFQILSSFSSILDA
jgi:hypothetical protein